MKNREKMFILGLAAAASSVLAMPMTAYAKTSISSVSFKLESGIAAGDSDNDVTITCASNKYSVTSAKIKNKPKSGKEWKDSDRPMLTVTLKAKSGYEFKDIDKSDVTVDGSGNAITAVKGAGAKGTGPTITVSVKLDRLDEDEDSSDDKDLSISGLEISDDGSAYWDEGDDVKKTELRFYRGGTLLESAVSSKGEYDFSKYFTQKGTYKVKARGVSGSKHGAWETSDGLTVDSEEADDIYENYKDSKGSSDSNDSEHASWHAVSGSSGVSKGAQSTGTAGANAAKGQASGPAASSSTGKDTGSGSWVSDSAGWWWRNEDGSYPKSEWKEIGGTWYHFGPDGYMTAGWFEDAEGAWYYLDPAGGDMKTGWALIDGSWFSFDPQGRMRTGWQEIDGSHYYLDASGAMLHDTVTPDGHTVDSSGRQVS